MRVLLVMLGLILSTVGLASAGTLAEIKERGALRVGLTGDYMPYSGRVASGEFHGADIAMAFSLASALEVELEFVPTDWRDLAGDLASDRFDIAMGGVSVTQERAAVGWFSIPVVEDGKRPIVRCTDKQRYSSLAAIDRPEVRVVVNPGGTNERFAKSRLAIAPVRIFPDSARIFDEIIEDRADVMITDGAEVDFQAAQHPGVLCPASVGAPFDHFQKAYLISPDPALVAAVDEWLERALTDGTWQEALAKAAEPAP